MREKGYNSQKISWYFINEKNSFGIRLNGNKDFKPSKGI